METGRGGNSNSYNFSFSLPTSPASPSTHGPPPVPDRRARCGPLVPHGPGSDKQLKNKRKRTNENEAAAARVFTLPRVEQLWCKDPKCPYNSHEHCPQQSCQQPPPPSLTFVQHQQQQPSDGGGTFGRGGGGIRNMWSPNGMLQQFPAIHNNSSNNSHHGSQRSRSDNDTRTTTMTMASTASSSDKSSNKYDFVMEPPIHFGRPEPPNSIRINSATKGLPPTPDELKNIKAKNSTAVQTSPLECPNGRLKHVRTPIEKCAACQYSPLAQFPNCVCRFNGAGGKMSDLDLVNPFWRFENRHAYLPGGFTLNAPLESSRKSGCSLKKFCTSHKIALVVSTFSLVVTIGLVITLLFMKKKGMMEPM